MVKFKFLILIVFALFLFGCEPTEEPPIEEDPIINPVIDVNPKNISMKVGDQFQVFPTISNTLELLGFDFVSNNELIASVDENGIIRGLSAGECQVEISLHEYPTIKAVITVVIEAEPEPLFPLSLSGPDELYVGETMTLVAGDLNHPENIVYWESSNPEILTVDADGQVTGITPGTATITISSYYTSDTLEKVVTVKAIIPTGVEIGEIPFDALGLQTQLQLEAQVLPIGASQEIIWSSSNDSIASVDEFGLVSTWKSGEVTIQATAKDTDLSAFITLKIEISPLIVFQSMHVVAPIIKKNVMYWAYEDPASNRSYDVYGSVSNFLFTDIVIDDTSYWLSSSALNFDARTFDHPEYIVIHDTWNPNGAGAATAAMVTSASNTKTCWHFSVGNDGVYQSLSEYQYGKHAGDGGRDFGLIDSGILSTTLSSQLSVSDDGYWTINDLKSDVLVPLLNTSIPTADNLTDSGIMITQNVNGNYAIGSTYYNSTYNVIANTGGNARGIGIETAMNFGSDLFLTWHYTAKLVAQLMLRHNLDISRVRQHNFFSGKDCPRTMRKAGMWPDFLKLVEAEYLALTNLKGYTITFISNDPEFVNNVGRIIKLPQTETVVSYTVQINKDSKLIGEKTFESVLPAQGS